MAWHTAFRQCRHRQTRLNGGATLYAGVVLVGKGLKSVKPEIVTFIQCVVGVLTLPVVDPAILHTSIELRQWGWLSGLGVIHTALVYALIYHALPNLKSSTIAILTFIYPASAIFFDFLVHGRLVSPMQFLGLVIVLLSSLGITQGCELPRFSAALVKLWSSVTVAK
jgi:drug/metabolite transporter (DMT)-like permease